MTRWERIQVVAAFGLLALMGCIIWSERPQPVHAASQFANIICDNFTPVSTAADAQLIAAGGANNFIYICAYNLNNGNAAANPFSLVEGTGATCATNTKALVGGTTAATGLTLGAAGGTINYGGGSGAVAKTTVAGNNVCILRTNAGPIAGVIASTQGPY